VLALPGRHGYDHDLSRLVSVSAHIKVDRATFFRFVASQAEGRFEYDSGRIVQQMTGGTLAHSIIAQRFISVFERRLDADLWVVTGHSRGVETRPSVRYPDVLVEPMSGALKALATEVPAEIVELLSPTTEELDLNLKLAEYRSIASLMAYVVASQDAALCWLWLRADDDSIPELPVEIAGLERVIDIPVLAVSIPLEEIYRHVTPPGRGKLRNPPVAHGAALAAVGGLALRDPAG
jgi:Uma2 family endonuclease